MPKHRLFLLTTVTFLLLSGAGLAGIRSCSPIIGTLLPAVRPVVGKASCSEGPPAGQPEHTHLFHTAPVPLGDHKLVGSRRHRCAGSRLAAVRL